MKNTWNSYGVYIAICLAAMSVVTCCWSAEKKVPPVDPDTLRPRKLLAPTTIDIFLGRIEIALDEKDHDHFLSLFSWTDAPANARTAAEKTFAELTAPSKKNPDIEVGRLSPNYRLMSVSNGYKYEPNIKPEGTVTISFAILDNGSDTGKVQQFSLPYGRENGEYKLVSIKQSKLGWNGPPDKSLSVSVLQCGVTDKLKVKGYYVYNVSGESVRMEFDSLGGYIQTFAGQYVEECSAKITEGKGAIRLVVTEGGEEVYGSEEHNSSSALVYKRPKNPTP